MTLGKQNIWTMNTYFFWIKKWYLYWFLGIHLFCFWFQPAELIYHLRWVCWRDYMCEPIHRTMGRNLYISHWSRDLVLSRTSVGMINSNKSILHILKAFVISDLKRALSFPCPWTIKHDHSMDIHDSIWDISTLLLYCLWCNDLLTEKTSIFDLKCLVWETF